MSTNLFISLPVRDLERSKAFYLALGASFKPELSDDNGVCVAWDDNVFFMMITRDFFATFTDKPIADPKETVQVSLNFSRDSREDVDAVIVAGLANGGTEPKPPQDYGFMYSRDLDDPDGNSLGFLYMAPEGAESADDAPVAAQA
jgi:uncharacterized protein